MSFLSKVNILRRQTAVFAFLLLPVVLSAGTPKGLQRARIEWMALPAAIIDPSADLKTGFLVVPERRFPAQGHRMVRLPFIIMKSRSASPKPDPVLFTAGGPGSSTLAMARHRQRNPLLEDRDVILLEQRGTRYAKPALMLPNIDEALRSGWGRRLNGDPDPVQVRKAMAASLRQLQGQGIDLGGYTTRESARDTADLCRLLEVPSCNLYGASYSTKVMLTVLRDHPEGIRSVMLDSVLPLEANWDEEAPANILEVLDHLLAVCAEDTQLKTLFPDLKARMFRVLAQANSHAVEVQIKHPLDQTPLSVRLDGVGIMNCVYAGLESAGGVRRLPLVLDAVCRGEVQALAPLLEEYLGSSQGSAIGMRLAVWCNEEFPFEQPVRMLRPRGLPPMLDAFVQTAVTPVALKHWPKGKPDPMENQPVASGVPVLIASGEFDPDTPVKWARATAARLPNAHLMVFSGMSHVPLFSHPEAARIMRAFLSDPSSRPDPEGIEIRPPFIHSAGAAK